MAEPQLNFDWMQSIRELEPEKEEEKVEQISTTEPSPVKPEVPVIEPDKVEEQDKVNTALDFSWMKSVQKDDDKDITPTVRTQPNESDEVTFEQLASDKNYMNMLREYQESRFGEEGLQAKDETNEEYVKRFLSHVREFETNSLDLGRQLSWVREAKPEMRKKFGILYSQMEKAPSFWEEGGTSVVSAIRDYGLALITDPINYIGLGAGSIARIAATRAVTKAMLEGGKKAAAEEAKKYGIKGMLKTKPGLIATSGIAAESGLAAQQSLKLQEARVLSGMQEEVSGTQAAAVGVIGLGLGAGGVAASRGIGSKYILQAGKERAKRRKKLAADYAKREKRLSNKAASLAAEGNKLGTESGVIFDKAAGREVLEELVTVDSKADFVAQAAFKKELMKRVGMVATDLVDDLARAGKLGEIVDQDDKASEVIAKLVKSTVAKGEKEKTLKGVSEQTRKILYGTDKDKGLFDTIPAGTVDSTTLKAALQRAGLTTEQFVNAMGASFSDAGAYLNTASKIGKTIKNRLKVLGLEQKEIDKLLPSSSEVNKLTNPFSSFYNSVKVFDRNRRAFMVSQIATTVRNVYTGGVRLPMHMIADGIESAMYHYGKGFNAATSGEIQKGTPLHIGKTIFRDAIGSLNRLSHVANTADLADALLKHNNVLASRFSRSLQETTDDEVLWKVSEKLNTLNIAQDLLFRRAILTDSLDKRLRRAGVIVDKPTKIGQFKSLEELSASGRRIPDKVLQKSVEDSLYFTFSRMPKKGGEKVGDTFGRGFIDFIESAPIILTGPVPFSRFMVGALQMQFDYSLAGFGMGVRNLLKARKLSDDPAIQDQIIQKSYGEISKGIVGTAALGAAILYRANNQDTPFNQYKTGEDTTVDLRPMYPLAPYLAIADVMVKAANGNLNEADAKGIGEAITGFQARTGASGYVVDTLFKSIAGQDKANLNLSQLAGEFTGEIFGSFNTPARVVRDIIAGYDTEEAVVRTSNEYQGLTVADRFFESFTNKFTKDIPIVSRHLPELESPTRESPVYRRSSTLGQLTGIRTESPRNIVEKELDKFGIKRYTIAPKTGDKEADSAIKRYLGKYAETSIADIISEKDYQSASRVKQKAKINKLFNVYRGIAKKVAEHEAKISKENKKMYTPFDRAKYFKLSNLQREIAEEWYQERYGKSVLEMQEEQPNVNHFIEAANLGKGIYKLM